MFLRNTLSLMLALGLLMSTFLALASEERTGVIRAVDQASQELTIDEQRYRISQRTRIKNLTETTSGLQLGHPVRFSADHGELKQITIYPKSAIKRRDLGYQTQNDFPQ